MSKKNSVFDGLLGDNTVLSSLMVISPVIMCGDTLRNAIAVIYAFSAITFLSVLAGSFVPKKLPYAVRIIIYTLISSLVYIPVKFAARQFFPEVIDRIGIYFMLLAVNSLIMVQTEAKFYRMKRGRMIFSLIFYILGFDAVMLITSFLRELIAHGTIYDRVADADMLISGFGMPFGGFIFLGLFCGLYRKIRSVLRRENSGGDSDASDN
ncbi:MAG: electron transport complex subunit E [Ruminococcus sp.]|nr:electron transport complex subunit E [Ruminococcus sp.]MDE6789743.1 electron transport complex subunit E [Ruminococcus sp.]